MTVDYAYSFSAKLRGTLKLVVEVYANYENIKSQAINFNRTSCGGNPCGF